MNNPDAFDFDEWQALYKKDPQAFEAKRQAVLEAELAKVPSQYRVKVQQALAETEVRCEGKSDRQRMQIASDAAVDSMKELAKGLQALRQTDINP
ncbi:MAG: DUF3135 domain-containing protein [Burkholderiaceae bacterium]